METFENNIEDTSIKITEATPEDVRDIVDVQRETWIATYPNEDLDITRETLLKKDFSSPEMLEKWRGAIENPESRLFVAKKGDRIVGFVLGKNEGESNRVNAIYILPEYQKRGIGKILMDKIFEWFGGGKEIKVQVATYNEDAINFYKRHGFETEPTNHQPSTSKTLLDAGVNEIPVVNMVKKLK